MLHSISFVRFLERYYLIQILSGNKLKEVKTTIISLKWEENKNTLKLPSKLLYFLPFHVKKMLPEKNTISNKISQTNVQEKLEKGDLDDPLLFSIYPGLLP